MDNPNLKLALLLASHGVKIFPCREKKGTKRNKKGEFPKEKAPYTINGFHDAATDELSIYRWWKQWPNAIVGIPCRDNNIIVLDADRHGIIDGVNVIHALFNEHGFDCRSVPSVITPTADGEHYIFQRPPALGDTEAKLANGIDVKDNGYVIAAGSIMANGRTYSLQAGTIMPSVFYKQSQVTVKALRSLMGGKVFDTPKDVDILARLFKYVAGKDAIFLDSFAGSGTTAHAVLALNKEDGGNRKFILVETEDYADKITAERVRRVIKGVKEAKDESLKKGMGGTFSFFELGKPLEMESILAGTNLPAYLDLARYIFFTATGEQLSESKVDEKRFFVGESRNHLVYLFYKPDATFLKSTALTLERARELGEAKEKRRMVFAPTKYLDQEYLDQYRIDFAQLPFEIYKLAR